MKIRPIWTTILIVLMAAFGCGDGSESMFAGSHEPAEQIGANENAGNGNSSGQPTGAAPHEGDQAAQAPQAGAPSRESLSEGESLNEEPVADPDETSEELQWIQLSTDDSTSMASAQLHKAGSRIYGHGLKVHEFLNYYDPPVSLFANEQFPRAKAIDDSLRFGLKADYKVLEIVETSEANEVDTASTEDEPTDASAEREDTDTVIIENDDGNADVAEEEPTLEPAIGSLELLFQMQADPVPHETRRNWNLFLCVDVSGSMGGEKIAFTIEALRQMLSHLKEGDRLTLTTFSSEAQNIFEDLEFSANEDVIRSAFESLSSGGGTNMIAGLRNSYDLAQANFREDMLHRVILFGDGSANVGETDLQSFNRLTRINGQEGIYLSGIGVGTDYAFDRMDALTDAGKGAHIFLPNRQEVDIIFGDYFPKVVEVAADSIAIEATLPAGVRLSGFSGEEVSFNPEQRLQNIVLAAGDDMTFTASFEVTDESALDEPLALKVTLRPLSTGEEVVRKIEVDSIRELIAAPGRLFERTRLIHRYAKSVVDDSEDKESLRQDLESYPNPDWGIRELISFLSNSRN